MIILDENLNDPDVRKVLECCGPKQVEDIVSLGFGGRDDSEIPTLLHQHPRCVFLTENTVHFFEKAPVHAGYCIVCVRKSIASKALPLLFRTPPFNSRKQRSGLITQVVSTQTGFVVEYYRKKGDEPIRVQLPR